MMVHCRVVLDHLVDVEQHLLPPARRTDVADEDGASEPGIPVRGGLTVMNLGRKLAEGAPEQIRHDPDVIAAYLGEDIVA